MNQRPLHRLEELIEESLDPRALQERLGLPHPLSNFAANGVISDGPYTDAVLKFMHDLACANPESPQRKAAEWFLFESEEAFFFVCYEAGIEAERLRSQLLRCKLGELNDQGINGEDEPGSA